jgi:hypothetical protein
MRAIETRAFDVTNDDGAIRHGIVVELYGPTVENRWAALALGSGMSDGTWNILSYHATPNEAINAIMAKEDPKLKDIIGPR